MLRQALPPAGNLQVQVRGTFSSANLIGLSGKILRPLNSQLLSTATWQLSKTLFLFVCRFLKRVSGDFLFLFRNTVFNTTLQELGRPATCADPPPCSPCSAHKAAALRSHCTVLGNKQHGVRLNSNKALFLPKALALSFELGRKAAHVGKGGVRPHEPTKALLYLSKLMGLSYHLLISTWNLKLAST